MLLLSKNFDMMPGQSTSQMCMFPQSSVYFILYGSPFMVDPAFLVATKNKVVRVL